MGLRTSRRTVRSEARLEPRSKMALAILGVLAHDEPLLPPFLGWAAALPGKGAPARRDSELLALRAAHLCRSPYEWAHHTEYALTAGLAGAEIERVAAGAD